MLAFGGRHLITRGVPPVGQFPIVPGGRELFSEWWGGWRSTGTGGPGNPPTAFILLAAGRALFFWAPSVFDKILSVGPVFIGVIASFRLARPLGSARSATIAARVLRGVTTDRFVVLRGSLGVAGVVCGGATS